MSNKTNDSDLRFLSYLQSGYHRQKKNHIENNGHSKIGIREMYVQLHSHWAQQIGLGSEKKIHWNQNFKYSLWVDVFFKVGLMDNGGGMGNTQFQSMKENEKDCCELMVMIDH